ncbi:hypothetical protein [Rhizobium leguminosarum]|nr:hypothetical protein [Rhizobium leguminosarum]
MSVLKTVVITGDRQGIGAGLVWDHQYPRSQRAPNLAWLEK